MPVEKGAHASSTTRNGPRHLPLRQTDVRGHVRLGGHVPFRQPPFVRDYAEIWRAADKIVYSTSLGSPSTAKTRLERKFDAGAVVR